MDFAATLRAVGDRLEAAGHPAVLIGGHALAAHGIVRATLDLDLLVPDTAQRDVLRLMRDLGYDELHASVGYSNHQHSDPEWGRVDFVYVGEGTATKILAAARQLEGPGGVPVQVPAPEHLASMKALAIKNDPDRSRQEIADIQALLRVPGIDRDEVREFFSRHGLLSYWDELA